MIDHRIGADPYRTAEETPVSPNPQLELENLQAAWSFATTYRERARIEEAMWQLSRALGRDTTAVRRDWLRQHLPAQCSARIIEAGYMLHRSLPATTVLWDRVDGPERMLMATAAGILSRARAQPMMALNEAIAVELRDYDALPVVVHYPEGTVRRRAEGVATPSALPPPAPASAPTVPPPPVSSPAAAPSHPHLTRSKRGPGRPPHDPVAHARWALVRDTLKQLIDAELAGLTGEHVRATLHAQLQAEIDGVVKMLQNRIVAAKRTAHLDAIPLLDLVSKTSRRELRAAYQILGVDAPRGGGPLAERVFAQARRNFKRLVREYHPDRGGNVSQYDAVVKAMALIAELQQPATQE